MDHQEVDLKYKEVELKVGEVCHKALVEGGVVEVCHKALEEGEVVDLGAWVDWEAWVD